MQLKRYGLQKVIPVPHRPVSDTLSEPEPEQQILYLTKSPSKKTRWSKRQQGIMLWNTVEDLLIFARRHLYVERVVRSDNGKPVRDRYLRPIKMSSYDEGMEIVEFDLSPSQVKPFKV